MCPSPTQPGTGHLGTGNYQKLQHRNEGGCKEIKHEQERGSRGSERSHLGISSGSYVIDALLMERADGRLSYDCPFRRAKENQGKSYKRGRLWRSHRTHTCSKSRSQWCPELCVWCLTEGKDGRLDCLTLDPDVNQG